LQVINCIWKHPNAPVVYLVCDMLGQEDVLIEVSKAFGSRIYVDRDKNSDCHQTLTHVAPEILAADDAAPSTRFHVIPFPRLSERAAEILALARARQQPEPLIIRPSSQWYAYYEPPDGSADRKPALTEPMRDEFGVWQRLPVDALVQERAGDPQAQMGCLHDASVHGNGSELCQEELLPVPVWS